MKPNHKEIKIDSSITKLKGYSEENYWSIRKSSDRDTFISNVIAKSDDKKIKINILYQGKPSDTPVDLLEKLLCTGDSSYNPSRPFRWYKGGNIMADTNSPESIKKCRDESFGIYLKQLDNPEEVFIYEIELLEMPKLEIVDTFNLEGLHNICKIQKDKTELTN